MSTASNSITTKNTKTVTAIDSKYVNDSATAQSISDSLDQELGDFAYFYGPVRKWISVPLPGGGTSIQSSVVYKYLRGTKIGYSVGGWTVIGSLNNPVSEDSDTDLLGETTLPEPCPSCSEDGGICFNIQHSDFPEVTKDDFGGGTAPGVFTFSWTVGDVTDVDGNPVEYLGGPDAGNGTLTRPVNITLGIKTDEEHDYDACTSNCFCDPCGAGGYFIDPAQCTASNRSSRAVPFNGLTCYECYFE